MTVNPHDAEETLRPLLLDVLESEEYYENSDKWAGTLITAQRSALDKALELLGVQR